MPVKKSEKKSIELVSPTKREQLKLEATRKFGRIDDEGRVFVKIGSGKTASEKQVGQYQNDEIDKEMTLFVQRFVDQVGKMEHFAMRVEQAASVTAPEIDESIAHFKEFAEAYNSVGDYEALQRMIPKLEKLGEERKERNKVKKAKEAETVLKTLQELVDEIETAVATLDKSPNWKKINEITNSTFAKWKETRAGSKAPEKTVNELWDRYSVARKTLIDVSKDHFKTLHKENAEVKRKKEAIIKEAESVKDTNHFDAGKRTLTRLMNAWKEAGRGDRNTDDAQWKVFNEMRDAFYERIPKEDKPVKREKAKWDNDTATLTAQISGFDALAKLKKQLETKEG